QQPAEINYRIDAELFSLPNGGSKTYESEILDAQGEKHIMLLSKSTYPGPDGKIAGLVGVMQDVTDRKMMLEELEHKNTALEKLDQLKSDFVAMVSHELRTPLSITKEGVSLVLDGIAGTINSKQSKILTTSKNNIDRLSRIINSLLDISKIESGRVELKKKTVDMEVLIKNVIASFQNMAKEKKLEIRNNLPKGQGLNLYVDEDRIVQVFTNLIGNSLKFTEKGHIDISLAQRENEVEFTVSDTGIGIAKEDIPRVFTKFLQFGRTPGGGEKGTGLGLSIAKGLVELHRGKIRVESSAGQGTKFMFTLPKYPANENAREHIEDAISEAIRSNMRLTLAIVTFGYSDKIKNIYDGLAEDLFKTIKAQLYRGKDLALIYPDEFFIIMRDCDKNCGLVVQGRIEHALRSYFEGKGLSNDIKINFGLATYPDEADSYQELVNKARLV
ncbi:MAG: ATP-binding protein, partial [Candidatus Omnitrophica bacterium]|nr:ATP-binding protein [Candidatus Omnitrophota bacterium]